MSSTATTETGSMETKTTRISGASRKSLCMTIPSADEKVVIPSRLRSTKKDTEIS